MRSIVKCEETLQIGGGYCLENGYIWWPQYGEVRAPQHIDGWERCLAPCWSRFDVPLTHHYSGITEPWHIDKWMGDREAEIRLRHADEMMPADHRERYYRMTEITEWVCGCVKVGWVSQPSCIFGHNCEKAKNLHCHSAAKTAPPHMYRCPTHQCMPAADLCMFESIYGGLEVPPGGVGPMYLHGVAYATTRVRFESGKWYIKNCAHPWKPSQYKKRKIQDVV